MCLLVCVCVLPFLGAWGVRGGGDWVNGALGNVYAISGWGAASWTCVLCACLCLCVASHVRVVIICPASTHTALVSSPSLAVLHLSTYLPTVSAGSVHAITALIFSF